MKNANCQVDWCDEDHQCEDCASAAIDREMDRADDEEIKR
jgi:hypothetical protein